MVALCYYTAKPSDLTSLQFLQWEVYSTTPFKNPSITITIIINLCQKSYPLVFGRIFG